MKKSMVFLILCLTIYACDKDPISKDILTDNPNVSNIDKLVHNTFRDYASKSQTAGFSIALIDGTEVYQYNYGETKLGNKTLPNNQTLYEIGSITKTFTSASLIHWLNQNSIDINSSIKNYLPTNLSSNLSLSSIDISFKHLLNHTSGLPRIPSDLPNNSDPYNGYDSLRVYNYISNHALLRTPGTLPTNEENASNYYSNLAYALAGLVQERQSHTSLQSIFQNTIFNILNMTNSTLGDIESIGNKAFPHNNANNASYWHLTGTAGAGGMKSCLSDMTKYAQAQINATNSTTLGTAFLTTQNPTVQINGKDYFGLGWEFYYTNENKRITVKDGGTGGFTAFVAFDRTTQKAIVALFNNDNSNNMATPFVSLLDEFFK